MANDDLQPVITVAVASDLHASAAPGDAAPSHMLIGRTDETVLTHPVPGLMKLVQDLGLRADILLCPGDLGNKAEPNAVRYAWNFINDLATKLNVSHTIATAGNHDVDSRHIHNKYDAKGVLQSLTPRFPLSEERAFDQYWSRHFAIVQTAQWRVVSLNSSAFHGTAELEYEHGRISPHTLEALKQALATESPRDLNILLCHHHPLQHSELGLGEHDLMKGGQQLLDLLGSGEHGQWMVVHGHKHHPKISYAASTTASSPIVFAAGSLSAVLYGELQTQARNQFYLLEFNPADIQVHGLVGRYRAWDWAVGEGWVPSRRGSGLPAIGGFGNRRPYFAVASDIANCSLDPFVRWDQVCLSCPAARFLLPHDEVLVERELKSKHNRSLLRNGDGQIEQVVSQ